MGDDWYGDDPTVNRLQELRGRAPRHGGRASTCPPARWRTRSACALHCARRRAPRGGAAGVARGDDRGDDLGGPVRDRVPHRRDPGPRVDRRRARRASCSSPTRTTTSRSSTCSRVENTVGGAGGRVMPLDELRAVRKVADDAGVPIHLDGARIFNAAAAAGVDAAESPRGRHGDVLPLEGARRADRLGALRSGGHDPRGAAAAGSCSAARGARPGSWPRRACRAGGRPRAARTRTTSGPGASPRASPIAFPGPSTSSRLKRTWCSWTPKPWGCRCSRRSSGWRPSGWASRHSGGKVRMVTHVDVTMTGIGDRARRLARGSLRDAAKERLMGAVLEELSTGDRPARPAGPAAREDVAGPALRADPDVRRAELGSRAHRARREPRSRSRTRSSGRCRTWTSPADMHCVTGWTTLDNTWEGVPFRTLTERAKPTPEAKWVIAHCAYGYTSNLSLEAMDDDDVLRRVARTTARTSSPSTAGRCGSWCPSATRGRARSGSPAWSSATRTSAGSGRCAATTCTRSRSPRSATPTRRARGPSSSPSARACCAGRRCRPAGGRHRRASRASTGPSRSADR